MESDHEFLTQGGVFTKSFIDNFVELKRAEARAVAVRVHPYEFGLYYDL
ncbi:hypothetical protein HMSSN139_35030 [Paenibacillus sp. HMSSN-139]|nr:hypothetical protein HMSSN139_35030 [Paenibacillus sp. HMSSN-139]